MRCVLLTFADSRLSRSLDRLRFEAEEFKVFNDIYTLTEEDLEPDFRERYAEKLRSNVRGYGYWCWKPHIIRKILQKLSHGDLLLYMDAGCHLNLRGIKRLKEYFSLVEGSKSGLLAFQAIPPLTHDGRALPDLAERIWTKGDVFDYFSIKNDSRIADAQQFGSGIIFFRKCKESEALVDEWLNAISYSFSMLDDTPSILPNSDDFIEHRHDQSIFSILCKLHGVDSISAYEYWYPQKDSMKPDWGALELMPIHAKRLRDFGILGNVIFFLKNKVKGLWRRLIALNVMVKNKK